MEKKVTVLTPNGRRQNVKITPDTTLLQILEEACKKHGFDSDEYSLKHHNKEIDLTQMFRFSGLPNNCLLEMSQLERKRVAANVDICVQLEDGSRKLGQFLPTDNLWNVVEKLSGEETENYVSPVAIYMRREIIGKETMTSTTLKSLGITEGRAMIRFINKDPEELKTQANVYVAPQVKPFVKEDDTKKGGKQTVGGGGFAVTSALVQSLKKSSSGTNEEEKEKAESESIETEIKASKPKYDWGSGSGHVMQSSQTDASAAANAESPEDLDDEPEINIVGERKAIIYSMDSVEKHIEDLPDSFFDLTVHDLKLVLRDLKKISEGNEGSPLLTEKLRQLEANKNMLNKIAQYKTCVIRIQFPNRHVLQGIFKPVDRIENVIEFVRKFIIDPDIKFYLFTIPPKSVVPADKTLLELDFVPNALLHFGVDEDDVSSTSISTQNYLKPELLEKLTTAEGALYAASKFRISSRKSSTETNTNPTDKSPVYESKPPGPSTGAIPKRRRDDDLQKT